MVSKYDNSLLRFMMFYPCSLLTKATFVTFLVVPLLVLYTYLFSLFSYPNMQSHDILGLSYNCSKRTAKFCAIVQKNWKLFLLFRSGRQLGCLTKRKNIERKKLNLCFECWFSSNLNYPIILLQMKKLKWPTAIVINVYIVLTNIQVIQVQNKYSSIA